MSRVKQKPPSLATREERLAWLKTLSPEELEALRGITWDKILKGHKVDVGGKQIPFKSFRDRVRQQTFEFERGVYDESTRTIPRWESRKLVPSQYVRPGALKQMLRSDEEEELQLVRMGNGNVFSPRKFFGNLFHGQRDFAFGVFARPDNVEAVFSRKWARRNPTSVIDNAEFYNDVVQHCHDLELTLMVYPTRALPLTELQPVIRKRMQTGAERINGGPLEGRDKSDIENFVRLFDETRVESSAWVDKGKIKPGTHLVMAAAPNGTVTMEAITPGTLQSRKTSYVGISKNSLVAKAAFDAFLGPQPVDEYGKLSVGHGILWCANGLKLYDSSQPNVFEAEASKDGTVTYVLSGDPEELPQDTSIFRIDDGRRMLLKSIQRRKALDEFPKLQYNA